MVLSSSWSLAKMEKDAHQMVDYAGIIEEEVSLFTAGISCYPLVSLLPGGKAIIFTLYLHSMEKELLQGYVHTEYWMFIDASIRCYSNSREKELPNIECWLRFPSRCWFTRGICQKVIYFCLVGMLSRAQTSQQQYWLNVKPLGWSSGRTCIGLIMECHHGLWDGGWICLFVGGGKLPKMAHTNNTQVEALENIDLL